MKALAVGALLITSAAFAASSGHNSVAIGKDADGDEIEIDMGERYVVRGPEDPTTHKQFPTNVVRTMATYKLKDSLSVSRQLQDQRNRTRVNQQVLLSGAGGEVGSSSGGQAGVASDDDR